MAYFHILYSQKAILRRPCVFHESTQLLLSEMPYNRTWQSLLDGCCENCTVVEEKCPLSIHIRTSPSVNQFYAWLPILWINHTIYKWTLQKNILRIIILYQLIQRGRCFHRRKHLPLNVGFETICLRPRNLNKRGKLQVLSLAAPFSNNI